MILICPPDCAERTATCHSTCRKYLDFVEENKAKKQAQFTQRNNQAKVDKFIVDGINKYKRRTGSK